MTVSEYLNILKSESTYITNSLILKSSDASGAIYKLLQRTSISTAIRKEVFIATEPGDILEDRIVIEAIEVIPSE